MRVLNGDTYVLLKKALDASHLRQQALTHNIANSNTPNFKANRVVFEEELKKSIKGASAGGAPSINVSLKTTISNHIGPRTEDNGVVPRLVKDQSPPMRNDGNNVDIDLEMANLAANQLLYNALIKQTNQKLSVMRHIILEGKG
ncbi:MAG: flagellar basal body rod protein FlgB [Clostridiales bacterium]|nr:flagellar basal body rod protein FlgB [Clostridiales bacterium]